MWKSTVLRGPFKWLGQGILEMGQRLDWLGAGQINLNVHFFFFLQKGEFFVLHRMVGRTPEGNLSPGSFELCNFPSMLV